MNIANSLTLLRLPLAGIIWIPPRRPRYVFSLILLAGLTDILDGWVARKLNMESPYGKWLDPFCDKIFVLSALGVVMSSSHFSIGAAMLIATRELIQGPLMAMYMTRILRPSGPVNFEAVTWGKITTCMQFGAMTAILFERRFAGVLVKTSAFTGMMASLYYVHRVFNAGARVWNR